MGSLNFMRLFFIFVPVLSFESSTAFVALRRYRRSQNDLWSYRSLLRRAGRQRPHLTAEIPCALSGNDMNDDFVEPDYLITDSVGLESRPNLIRFLVLPRNLLALVLVATGFGLTAYNVVGTYNDGYVMLQELSVLLALLSSLLDFQAITSASLAETTDAFAARSTNRDPRYSISPNVRCGCSDDALVHSYAATYTAACAWLGLRTSVVCPSSLLVPLDLALGSCASLIFVSSLLAPALTLLHHYQLLNLTYPLRLMVRLARQEPLFASTDFNKILPSLTSIELLRAQSLLAIGIIGCIFAPEAIMFVVKGQDWWLRSSEVYHGQPWIESTNALFGVYATQLSMIAHRAGKQGVAAYSTIVPVFTLVCLVLTVVPSACSLYWWGDQISFFDFYSV